MTAHYSHSLTFHTLKHTQEHVTGNLTSAQYLNTLDMLIWRALEPIALNCPDFFYNYMAKCVAHQTVYSSSKYTSGNKLLLPLQLAQALMLRTTQPDQAIAKCRKMYINRGLLLGLSNVFIKIAAPYLELQKSMPNGFTKPEYRSLCASIEQSLSCVDPQGLYQAIQQTIYWDSKACEWRNVIVEKYTRMALGQAQKTYVDFGHVVDLDDISQIYLMVSGKAIDRCDARRGVLTTFIQNWLKGARSQVGDLANSLQNDSLEELYEAHGDDTELGYTEFDTTTEEMQAISYAAQIADPDGLVRTSLGIPQYISAHDRQILLKYAVN
jgi:hypothetical protein